MPRFKIVLPLLATLFSLVCFALVQPATAAEDEPLGGKLEFREPKKLPIKEDDGSAERAIGSFHVAKGLKCKLWASEPMFANPNSMSIDEQGRVYVSEANRFKGGVLDVRDMLTWLDEDIASKSVADRVAMVKKHASEAPGQEAINSTDAERIVQMTDSTGSGKADKAVVYTEGYNRIEDGLASGVFAYHGDVYATIIPNLYKLKDTNNDGKADERKVLSTGYGVRYAFIGHDLHGMTMGPDGRLYFSVGDRAASAEAVDGSFVMAPETGSVFRCNLDGSELELFATGLRNPQELAFDDHGNLFTGDNNPDKGDPARWVYVTEQGDSGWRIGYQYGKQPIDGGPWTAEQIFQTAEHNNANYIIPHIAHAGAGPSGVWHYSGVGLPDRFKDVFFMCDYRGQAVTSGIWTFKTVQDGATFKLTSIEGTPITRDVTIDKSSIFTGTGVVDCEQGPDGSLYMADWTQGWDRPFRGRVYRLVDEDIADSALVRETKQLIAQGMKDRPETELVKLLAHPDSRVRREAQYALAVKGEASVAALLGVAKSGPSLQARLHGIWGLWQISHKTPEAAKALIPLLTDKELEVRCQVAKVLGDAKSESAFGGLMKALSDPEPRVRYFAAMALGKLAKPEVMPALLNVLKENADKDPVLRYGVVWALEKVGDEAGLSKLSKDSDVPVRLGAALALRRMQSAELANFLGDSDRIVALEAARAINDLPIDAALPAMAALVDKPMNKAKGHNEKSSGSKPGPSGDAGDWIMWRVANAAYRLGTPESAKQLAALAVRTEIPSNIRVEALHDLMEWAKPGNRDRITNLFRPLLDRDAGPAREAAKRIVDKLADDSEESVKVAAARLAQKYGLGDPAVLAKTVTNGKSPADVRLAALATLVELKDAHVPELLKTLTADKVASVRHAAIQQSAQQAKGVELIGSALSGKDIGDSQAAIDGLADSADPKADGVILEWMQKLLAKQSPPEMAIEIIEAAQKRKDPKLAPLVQQYKSAIDMKDPLGEYRDTLVGGDADAGYKVFSENAAVSCVRCHMVNNQGGIVGPHLDGVGAAHPRDYLLAAVVTPNAQVAPGFESLVVQTTDGKYKNGVVKKDDDKELVLMDAENNLVTIPKSQVKSRERGPSAMPEGLQKVLTHRDLRNLVEWLSSLKTATTAPSLNHGADEVQ